MNRFSATTSRLHALQKCSAGKQARVVSDFVQSILALDANANVVVLGDLNDFEFSETLGILKSADLTDLAETLPPEERYTYVFEGNSQVVSAPF